jgi:hypothetical protein
MRILQEVTFLALKKLIILQLNFNSDIVNKLHRIKNINLGALFLIEVM